MKTNIIKTALLLTSISLFISCTENTGPMYTRINPDGSCYREFTTNADSAFMAGDTTKNPFPIKIDSTWKRVAISSHYNVHLDKKNHKKDSSLIYNVTIRKHYPSVKNLAETFRFNHSHWDSIVPKVCFNKKFRWFYTYYDFSETYPKINPFKKIQVSNYLSDEETGTLYGNNTDLFKGKNGIEIRDMLNEMEGKANAWLNRSYYEEVYRLCLKHYRLFKDLPVDSARFAMAKDSIYELNKDSLNSDGMKIENAMNKFFKTDAFSDNKMPNELDEKMKKEIPDFMKFFGMEINYELSMPGKIIKTNTPIAHSDTLTWKVDAYRFFFNDYTLKATSRKPNYWAFGVTGIIVVLSLLGFWVRRK